MSHLKAISVDVLLLKKRTVQMKAIDTLNNDKPTTHTSQLSTHLLVLISEGAHDNERKYFLKLFQSIRSSQKIMYRPPPDD